MGFIKKPKSKQAHGTAPKYTLDNGIRGDELADQSHGECECEEDFYDDEDVDDSVREDMDKLEDSFPGVSDRFRLVNRIGEGMLHSKSPFYIRESFADGYNAQVPSRPYTKQKTFCTITTGTTGICFGINTTMTGRVRHPRSGG